MPSNTQLRHLAYHSNELQQDTGSYSHSKQECSCISAIDSLNQSKLSD